ncbi:ABC transporter permease [Streptomyces tubbatahanensis]|uniref:ABC transporter permease n=1 Tax=Streptomyces tubbatahanensis TaxID=2923272 RepID=A0ABY3XUL2_9ACTN|nr:ABC transporter permease [Streptomyces tubbatahanensis]UNS98065.1 ABC transporter permease [Streptomyces tubbatahanensis]
MSAVTDAAPRDGGLRRQGTGRAPGGNALAGTGVLVRFALRRDRLRLPAWVLAVLLVTLSGIGKAADLAPDPAALGHQVPPEAAGMSETLRGPAMLAMTGPEHYLTHFTPASVLSMLMIGYGALLVGLMSVLTVVRHTRADEERGIAELLRSGVVGRHATLSAALAAAAVADVALGALFALVLPAVGPAGVTGGGALLYGAAHAAVGLVFAGVAAVTVQLSAHARAAGGMALAALGAAYALRAAGDVGAGPASWLSPIGWAQRTYPFVDDRWWPLLPALALALATAAAGYALSTRRDVGAGVLAARPGPPTASAALTRPLGFALRLHRGLLAGFCAALLLLGAMYGSLFGSVDDMLKDLDDVREAIARGLGEGGSFVESFASTIMLVVAVAASLHVVMAALRPRAEETAGRAEPLLATGLSRTRWLGSHLALALGGGTVVLLAGSLGLGLAGSASAGDSGLVWRLLGAGLAYAPALWVTGGVAALLFGWAPRAAALAGAVPAYGFVVGYLGKLLDLPGWLNDLSPFGHVPQLPSADLRWTPVVLLTLVAAVLVAAGLAGFRRRDLDTK